MIRLMLLLIILTSCASPPPPVAWVGTEPEPWVRFVDLSVLATKKSFDAPHAITTGVVVSVTGQKDGDFHIVLENDDKRIVLEPIPQLMPERLPRIDEPIDAWGIVRWDLKHGWAELHPLLGWRRHGQWDGPKFVCVPPTCMSEEN